MNDNTKNHRNQFKNHETLNGFVIKILIAFLIFLHCSQTGRPTDKIFTE